LKTRELNEGEKGRFQKIRPQGHTLWEDIHQKWRTAVMAYYHAAEGEMEREGEAKGKQGRVQTSRVPFTRGGSKGKSTFTNLGGGHRKNSKTAKKKKVPCKKNKRGVKWRKPCPRNKRRTRRGKNQFGPLPSATHAGGGAGVGENESPLAS